MRRAVVAGAAVLVAAVVAVGVIAAGDTGPAQPSAPAGSGPATDLSGSDPVTGEQVALADFAGTPVVLNFWADWCPGCHAEAPELVAFAAEHPEAQVVGVNFQDSRAGARDFHARYGLPFPSIADPDGRIGARLRLQGMPTTIFLDADHREVTRIVGETDRAGFEAGLREATGS